MPHDRWGRPAAACLARCIKRVRSTARWAANHLGLSASEVDRAIEQPERHLRSSNPQIGQIAWIRFARQDSVEAFRRWRQAEPKTWPAEVRSFIPAQIASLSMLRMQPQAIEASREALRESRSLGANAIDLGVLGSDESLAIMARSALRAQDWDSLQQLIGWMSARGQADPAWQYWRARAYQRAGDEPAARALFKELASQFHFYGQLALEDLGQAIELPPRAAKPTSDELKAIAASTGIQRAFKLYQLGLRTEAHREWWVSIKPMNDRALLAAAELACRRLVLDRCVNTADRTKQEHDFHLRFIMPFRDELEAAALCARCQIECGCPRLDANHAQHRAVDREKAWSRRIQDRRFTRYENQYSFWNLLFKVGFRRS
ncbi:MAG: hypothetical protein EBT41_05550 [Betaproteobacteria bacterium]|nr:hypothetical protein [Betaproteobacteria bacterium]